MRKFCPLDNENARETYNIQEAEIVGQVVRDVPRIYTTLEGFQADYQSMVVEVASKIVEQSISMLIDLGSTHNYIAPRVVEIFAFKKLNHSNSWLVHLDIRTKRNVSEVVEKCPLVMNGLVTCVECSTTWFL